MQNLVFGSVTITMPDDASPRVRFGVQKLKTELEHNGHQRKEALSGQKSDANRIIIIRTQDKNNSAQVKYPGGLGKIARDEF